MQDLNSIRNSWRNPTTLRPQRDMTHLGESLMEDGGYGSLDAFDIGREGRLSVVARIKHFMVSWFQK